MIRRLSIEIYPWVFHHNSTRFKWIQYFISESNNKRRAQRARTFIHFHQSISSSFSGRTFAMSPTFFVVFASKDAGLDRDRGLRYFKFVHSFVPAVDCGYLKLET